MIVYLKEVREIVRGYHRQENNEKIILENI